ncbi:MAG: hypothetical protein NUW23_08295 [Firmicutes bacterium]|nr:hypothetical protein [Bacillota bacterium]
MKLRKKVLIICLSAMAALTIAVWATARLVVLPRFARLEEDWTHSRVEAATYAFAQTLQAFETLTRDYAEWDDTYEFVVDGNQAYISSNFVMDTFVNNRLHAVYITRPVRSWM